MRSVVVVFPASMWAMMPKLRSSSLAWLRAMILVPDCLADRRLPAVVGEGAVGFSHPVRILALFDRCAPVVRGVEQFCRQTIHHGLVVAVARCGDDPADRQRLPAIGAHFDRDLVGRATDPPRANLD